MVPIDKLSNKLNKPKLGIFKILKKLFPIVFASAPILFSLCMVFAILHGASWGVITMMQQRFFDQAALLVGNQTSLNKVIISFILLGIAYLVNNVLNGADNFIRDTVENKIMGKMSLAIHKKVARLNPIDFEDTSKLDNLNKAEQGKNNSVLFTLDFTSIFTFYLPYFVFMGWYLFSFKPILAVSLALIFVPMAATQIIRSKVFAKAEDKSAPVRREYDYYESCIVGREYYKETRLLGGFAFFNKMYLESLDILQKINYKATIKTNLIELSMQIFTVIGYFGVLLMLFHALMNQEISIGVFSAVFESIGRLYAMMRYVICGGIGNMAKSVGTIENYLNFLEMDERKSKVDIKPEWGDISLESVSFSYPNFELYAVKNVSLTLKKGETIAIVGENGSGKSTLLRLITGLYLPTKGRVTVSGFDTKDIPQKTLYENTTAVFQKYQRYQMILEENITISQNNKEYEESTLDNVCEVAGINKDDSGFTDGYKTMLSREFEGVDLSGGQWQRVAIARGLFRDHDLIVLDEPTAAIDPYEETRIYNRFADISRGKSAIIVTHRLGSAKIADRIVVMKNGEIKEIGTHDELVQAGKEYTRLYTAQEQWYS